MARTILVTGGAGFIGANLVRHLIERTPHRTVVADKLTYAGNLSSLEGVSEHPRFRFEQLDVCDGTGVQEALRRHQPDAILHLAAESHVDRSIDGPDAFIQTNIVGTYALLEAALHHFEGLPEERRGGFRFLHVSTDEVYGTLGEDGLFSEATRYDPRSPYSASKASADHLARAWYHTYGLPVLVTNCSNNYGPYQYPEKLIPVVIAKALAGDPVPVYGRGENVRDWLYVEDHVRGLLTVLERGRVGETYNIGAHNERTNLEVVTAICRILDERADNPKVSRHEELITFISDRPGHDYRYAVDAAKITLELGWRPEESFAAGLEKTVDWYLRNQDWCKRVLDGKYDIERLGLGRTA